MALEVMPMTREQMHEMHRGFSMDQAIFGDMELYEKVKNTRSQHILEKLGFQYMGEEEGFKQYRLERK